MLTTLLYMKLFIIDDLQVYSDKLIYLRGELFIGRVHNILSVL